MPTAESTANAVWEGDLAHGGGRVAPGSGAFEEQEVTWASRTSRSAGKTSPEELIAAAHAACYAMAFSNTLTQDGNPPQRLHVVATVSLDRKEGGGVQVTRSALEVTGEVAGLDQAAFADAATRAEQACPISNTIRGNVEVTVSATLRS